MDNGHSPRGVRSKIINDALHGIINIKGKCLEILDTPQFQRLRHIKQLQASHYVFPSAQHTRLEHSLGTYHLAGTLLDKFKAKQPGLEIRNDDFEAVQMAALCHDIGHGCFSHMLDYEIFPRVVKEFHWEHEKRSCEILENCIDENNIDIDHTTLCMIQSLILGDKSKANIVTSHEDDFKDRKFLWNIVANSEHGIDVDKFDYLARDSRECGIKISFDHVRVMELMRVVDDQICFNSRGVESVYDLFHARSRMYRNVYFHKATRSVERMIADALLEANHVLKLQDAVHNIDKFCKLDDTILREIARSDDPSLKKSQELIRKIEKRELYKYVDEFVVPLSSLNHFKVPTADDLMRFKPAICSVNSDDLVIQKLEINYGRGSANPVDLVGFFDDREEVPKRYTISKDRVSNLVPQTYKDVTVRVYLKNQDQIMEDETREMFAQYQKKIFGKEVMRTPSLKRKYSIVDGADDNDVNCSQTQPQPKYLFPTARRKEDNDVSEFFT